MVEDLIQAELLLSIPNTEVYDIVSNQKRLITSGELQAFRLDNEHLYLLKIGDFSYSLSKELPVMKGDSRTYAFPSTDGFMGVVFPIDVEQDALDVFEIILKESTDFTKIKDRRNSVPETATSDTEIDIELKEGQVLLQKSKKVTKVSNFIEDGGSKIKRGLIRGATITSNGIAKGGEYLKKKLKKKDKPTVVSEKSNKRIKQVKMTTQMVLVLSKALVSGALQATSQIASAIADKFKGSKTANRLDRSKAYQAAKEIGRAGINAAITIYDGLEESLVILAKSSASTTVGVVEHRYGEQAAFATAESFGAIGNVGSMYREVKKLGIKSLAKVTAKKAAIEILEEEKKEEIKDLKMLK